MPIFPQNWWPFRYGAGAGICGGMVFMVRDFFEAHLTIPPDWLFPTADAQVFQYAGGRLIDSLASTIVFQYYEWQTQSNAVDARRTIVDQLPQVKAALDAGHFCCLGLIESHTADPSQLGSNHQVLAYRYEALSDGSTVIWLYDPNSPNDDSTKLTLSNLNPRSWGGVDPPDDAIPPDFLVLHADSDTADPYGDRNIRGFFTVPYEFHMPPSELFYRAQYIYNISLTAENSIEAPSSASILDDNAIAICWTDMNHRVNLAIYDVQRMTIVSKVALDGHGGWPNAQSSFPPALAWLRDRGYIAWVDMRRRLNVVWFNAAVTTVSATGAFFGATFSPGNKQTFSPQCALGPALTLATDNQGRMIVYLAWTGVDAARTLLVANCWGDYGGFRMLSLREKAVGQPTLWYTSDRRVVLCWLGTDRQHRVNVTWLDGAMRYATTATANKMTFNAPTGGGRPAFAMDAHSIRMAWIADMSAGFGTGQIGAPGGESGGHVDHPLASLNQRSPDISRLLATANGHGDDIPAVVQNRWMTIQGGASITPYRGAFLVAWCGASVLDAVEATAPDISGAAHIGAGVGRIGEPGASNVIRDNRIRVGHYIQPISLYEILSEVVLLAVPQGNVQGDARKKDH